MQACILPGRSRSLSHPVRLPSTRRRIVLISFLAHRSAVDFFSVAFIVAPFAMVAGGTIGALQIYKPQNVIAWGEFALGVSSDGRNTDARLHSAHYGRIRSLVPRQRLLEQGCSGRTVSSLLDRQRFVRLTRLYAVLSCSPWVLDSCTLLPSSLS